MKIVFLGSASIAVPSLERLLESEHEILFSITRPDKPAGRHRAPKPPPLKPAAEALGVEVLQPAKARDAVGRIVDSGADICVVVAYGGWLPPPVLDATRLGCVNLHPSLLPRWRGAAPVERAIMAQDSVTGVSTMLIDEGLDTGPLLMQREATILPGESAGELSERLGVEGAALVVESVDALDAGALDPAPQSSEGVTYAEKLEPEDCRIDWTESADAVVARVRGANPRPGAWTELGGKRLKVWRAQVGSRLGELQPGEVAGGDTAGGEFVACAAGKAVVLDEVQPEGKARMAGAAFVRGHSLGGVVLGS